MVRGFDEELFRALSSRAEGALGHNLTYIRETGSTNDDALRAAREGAPHGALFVTDWQTRGRGRRGHTWESGRGENLTFSLLLRPRLPLDRLVALPLPVGLAVRELVARLVPQSEVRVKWPNDVMADSKKIAGILVESQLCGHQAEAVVVGVGLNVHMLAVPAALEDRATSLALLGVCNLRREELLVGLLSQLEQLLGAFEAKGLDPLLEALTQYDFLQGRRVRVGEVSGIAAGIDPSGALRVDTPVGVRLVTAGGVELA